jgi:hypothetical protein
LVSSPFPHPGRLHQSFFELEESPDDEDVLEAGVLGAADVSDFSVFSVFAPPVLVDPDFAVSPPFRA